MWERRQDQFRGFQRKNSKKEYGDNSPLPEDESDEDFYVPGEPKTGKYFQMSNRRKSTDPSMLNVNSNLQNFLLSTF